MDIDFPQLFSDTSPGCNYIFDKNYIDQNIAFSPVLDIELKLVSADCNDKKTTVYSCSVCDKIFLCNCNLMQHAMIHKQNTTIYICSTCSKIFFM